MPARPGSGPKPGPRVPPALRNAAVMFSAAEFGVDRKAIDRPGARSAWVALARHVAIYLVVTEANFTRSAAAEVFLLDRTSVDYAVKRIEAMRESELFDRVVDHAAERFRKAALQ